MPGPKRSIITFPCAFCAEIVDRRPSRARRFCSQKCAGQARGLNKKATAMAVMTRWGRPKSAIIQKKCEWCKKTYSVPDRTLFRARRFCSQSCSNTWKQTLPHAAWVLKKMQAASAKANKGRKRPDISARMKGKRWSAISIERMRRSLRKTLLKNKAWKKKNRARISRQQIALTNALGYPKKWMEYCVASTSRYSKIMVDIVHLPTKTAIEVDGTSHRLKRQKQIDRWKTKFLNSLGWSVLRFLNQEIDLDLKGVAEKVRSFTTSRSKTITTSSRTES